jgi:drug/metabolite transporter (DMT)-like permease
MIYLWIVSLIWAFSFGMIKGQLAGLDSTVVATIRLLLATLTFLPFMRLSGMAVKKALQLAAIGAVQFGMMYICYIAAYAYLAAWQIALFTITTPLYIAFLDDLLHRRFDTARALAVLLALLGSLVLVFQFEQWGSFVTGLFLVQLSNLAFAIGQLAYKRVMHTSAKKPLETFGLLYGAATLVSGIAALVRTGGEMPVISTNQWLVLVYLGIVASGVCFFLWNYGALRTSVGKLAIMNNMKIPIAMSVSLLFFGESADPLRLALGSGILACALWVQQRSEKVMVLAIRK